MAGRSAASERAAQAAPAAPAIDLQGLAEMIGDQTPSSLMEMLDIFVADFATLMDGVSQSLRHGGRQDLARAAHAAKSAATSACAKPLAQILGSIEQQQATDADLSHLEQMLADVTLGFARVQAELAANSELRSAAS